MPAIFTAQYRKAWAALLAAIPALLAINFPETAGIAKAYILWATPIIELFVVAAVPNAD
jgi:hypothetical protein